MAALKPREHAYQKFQLQAIALSRFQVSGNIRLIAENK
jgi:hypothetical protein